MKRVITFLTTVHRYLGLVFCLIFLVWFASGIVMIYARMPEYGAAERLARLAPIDAASIRLTPAEALEQATLADAPGRIRISTLRSRPVYRFFVQGEWVTLFADDGSVLEQLSPDAAVDVARDAFPSERSTARFVETRREPDQWTIGMRGGPLHVVSLGDAAATNVYVASDTGEIVLKTDRSSRFWGYAGPVTHWFYFRPLRVKSELWYNLIVYGSVVGCILSIIGLVIGVYRYSLSRLRAGLSATPYAGWLRWHHYAGLIFGVITFTWLFSGLLSMEPWGISEDPAPRRAQVVAVRGDGVNAARFTMMPRQVLDTLRHQPGLEGRPELIRRPHALDRTDSEVERRGGFGAAKEIELIQFMDAPFYRVQDEEGRTLLLTADHGPNVKEGFTESELRAAADAAMPGARAQEAVWLTRYDSYYYDRAGDRPLPVLRVKYADADRSWLYLSSRDGGLLLRETAGGRPVRWLYHGLHSLDFPGLYQAGWMWEAAIVMLCAGGLLLSMTSVIVGWRFLRK